MQQSGIVGNAHRGVPDGLFTLQSVAGGGFDVIRIIQRLTTREREVLHWLLEPGTIDEIARRHRNKTGTLRKHIDNLRDKTGLRTRRELVLLAATVALAQGGGASRTT